MFVDRNAGCSSLRDVFFAHMFHEVSNMPGAFEEGEEEGALVGILEGVSSSSFTLEAICFVAFW